MNIVEDIIEKMRIFHYSTLIPINLIENDKSLFKVPEEIHYASWIINSSFSFSQLLSLNDSDENDSKKPFYFKNDFEECLIMAKINKELHLLAGPVLTEKISENSINRFIRQNKLSIEIKKKLLNHYASLPIMNSNRLYYCGRLIDNLFLNDSKKTFEEDHLNPIPSLPNEYYANMINNRQSLFHHAPYFLEQELVSKIKAADLSGAISVLNEINALKKAKLAPDRFRSLKNSLICSITLFTRAAIEGGVPPEAAFTLSDSIILQIESIDDIYKLMDCEYKAVEQYTKMVQELSKNKYSNIVQQALSYIYKNLTSKLTLKKVSEAVFVHSNYLSSLFIKEVGISLPDYIMKTRVEESKYYIRYTNTKISDIATFYQFCNQSYFTEAFKKYVGLTPGKYRRKYSNQNE